MFKLENEAIRVELEENNLSLVLTDKKTGTRWNSEGIAKMLYGYAYSYDLAQHCKVELKQENNKISIRCSSMVFWSRFKGQGYIKPEPGPDLEFEFSIILNSDHVVFRIEKVKNMNDEECVVTFPYGLTHLDSNAEARLVFPHNYGAMYEFPRKDMLDFEAPFGVCSFNMPVYGVFKENSGLGVYIKTPFDSAAAININNKKAGRSAVDINFIFNRDRADYAREIAFYPIPDGNHVKLAKLYRNILKKENRFVSLDEKIKNSPEVEKLIGTVILKNNTFSKEPPPGVKKSYSLYMMRPDQNEYEGLPGNWTAREIFDTAQKRGFDRVCVYNTGWNNKGYDSGYPTRFPPNPERGTFEDFQRDAEYARSLSKDYIYSVHDNYRDVYKNSPEFDKDFLITDKNNVPAEGGIWRGGRAYPLCPESEDVLKYIERDIPRIREMLGRGSIYIDVLGCVAPLECYHKNHPMGRRTDAARRKELLQYIKNEIGSVATETAPSDYLNEIVDLGAFGGIHFQGVNVGTSPCLVPVPLYQLVYHDSVLNYTVESAYNFYGSEYLLYVALYGLLPFSLEPISLKLSKELREAYKSEMVSHEFLEKAVVKRDEESCFWTGGVQKTVFSDGTEVIANFNDTPYCYDNEKIEARNFLIKKVK
ncbi:MAG: DUF5696 domain-containing protein [Victivallaceae bacterium]